MTLQTYSILGAGCIARAYFFWMSWSTMEIFFTFVMGYNDIDGGGPL